MHKVLVFVVENGEIRPGLAKTRVIVEYPPPADVHSIRYNSIIVAGDHVISYLILD